MGRSFGYIVLYGVREDIEYGKISEAVGDRKYDEAEYEKDIEKGIALRNEWSKRLHPDRPLPNQTMIRDLVEISVREAWRKSSIIKSGNHTVISSHKFGLKTVSKYAKKLSRIFDSPVISWACFDDSVFLMQVHLKGELRVSHQIGEGLSEVGLEEKKGDPVLLAEILNLDKAEVSDLLAIEDADDAIDRTCDLLGVDGFELYKMSN